MALCGIKKQVEVTVAVTIVNDSYTACGMISTTKMARMSPFPLESLSFIFPQRISLSLSLYTFSFIHLFIHDFICIVVIYWSTCLFVCLFIYWSICRDKCTFAQFYLFCVFIVWYITFFNDSSWDSQGWSSGSKTQPSPPVPGWLINFINYYILSPTWIYQPKSSINPS